MRSRSAAFVLALSFLIASPFVFAQQPPPKGPRPPGDQREREGFRPEGPPREGIPEMRDRGFRKEGFFPGLRMDGPIFSTPEANAVDQARFQIAALLVEQKKFEDAIGELLKMTEESPDETARAAAHLSAGNIFRQCMKDFDKAIEQYREVKGRLTDIATKLIVEAYQEAGEPEAAVKELENILSKTQDPGQKVRLLTMIADVYRRSGNADKAIETLRKLTETLSYDDAEAMRRGWMDDEALLGKMQEKLQDLRAAGRDEEANELQKRMDEIKNRKQMREALKKQKRAEKEPAKPEGEGAKEK